MSLCIRARDSARLVRPQTLGNSSGADHRFTKPSDFQQMLTFAHGLDCATPRRDPRSRQEIFFTPCRGYTCPSAKFYGSTVHPKADEGFSFSDCSNLYTRKIEQRTHGQSVQIGS